MHDSESYDVMNAIEEEKVTMMNNRIVIKTDVMDTMRLHKAA